MNILMKGAISENFREMLAEKFPMHEFVYAEKPTAEQLEVCEVYFGLPTEAEIAQCKNLKLLQAANSGVKPYCAWSALSQETVLCSATGAFGEEIAEAMLAMLLAIKKNLHHYRDRQNAKNWEFYRMNRPINGSKVLILGLGDIGMSFAKQLSVHNCHVIGIKRNLGKLPEYVNEIYTEADLDRLIPEADVIAMCLPDTAQTQNMMSAERVMAMKKGSVIINVGRSESLDWQALLAALASGQLEGAAIDVAPEEPLPNVHELWTQENLIITPHSAGRSFSPNVFPIIIDLFCKNLSAFMGEGEYASLVDRSSGYMKSRD